MKRSFCPVEEARGAHGLKRYSSRILGSQMGMDRIPICEMKIRYENWLKSQTLRSDGRNIPAPILVDPITGVKVESISPPFRSKDLAEAGKNTLDFYQKTVSSSNSGLNCSKHTVKNDQIDWQVYVPEKS